MRIFTGAPMPDGADTVFMQEDVRIDDDGKVVLPAGLKPGANVRPAGEDIPPGHAALAAGLRLRPQDVALAAAFGLTHLEVIRRIRVAVFSTGNELVSPGSAARAGATVRFQPLHADGDAGAARLRGQRSRHFARRSRVAGAGLKKVAGTPRSDPDHRRRFDRRRRPRQGRRRKRRHAGAVADGDQARTSGRDGNYRRHAVHRTAGKSGGEFCHLCPCGAADGAGAVGRRATAAGSDAGSRRLQLQEEDRPPRICPGQSAQGERRRARGDQNFRARARACCRRWSTPTAWSNSARQITQVEPGQTVGFLSYASLI